jgi:hypothetical protein
VTEDHPSLDDSARWAQLGRDHGRRAAPADGGKPHVVTDMLQHALFRAVLEHRKKAVQALEAVDRDRYRLRREQPALAALTADTPPGAARQAKRLAALDQELAARDMARQAVNDQLELTLGQLREQAAQADAAFRESYAAWSRMKGLLPAVADLDLPDDLRGPIPDPLEHLVP